MAEALVTPIPAQPPADGELARTKRILNAIAAVIVFPMIVTYRLGIRMMPDRKDMIFQGYSESLSLRPGVWGIYLRRAFYRRTLIKCGRHAAIGFGTTFATPDIEIGEGVIISNYCNIGHVRIDDYAMIGLNAHILSGKHQHYFDRLDVPIRYQGGQYKRIRIGRDVWVGNHAVVLEDVGDQAVVAAGALVRVPVPARALVAGNPAKSVGVRGPAAPNANPLGRHDRAAP